MSGEQEEHPLQETEASGPAAVSEEDPSDEEVLFHTPAGTNGDRLLSDLVAASREAIEEQAPVSRVEDAEGISALEQPASESPPSDTEESGPRFFGVLKSTGDTYGFIACRQTKEEYGRDVYIAKSELPSECWIVSQAVSFAVILNDRGRPQARDVQKEDEIPEEAKLDDEPPPTRTQSAPNPTIAPPWLASPSKAMKSPLQRSLTNPMSSLSTPKSAELKPLPTPAESWADIVDEDDEPDYGSRFEARAEVLPKTAEESFEFKSPLAQSSPPSETGRSPASAPGRSPGFGFTKSAPFFVEEEDDDELGEWGRRRRMLPGSVTAADLQQTNRHSPKQQYAQQHDQQASSAATSGDWRSSETTDQRITPGPEGLFRRLMQTNAAERKAGRQSGWDAPDEEEDGGRGSDRPLVGLSLTAPPARQRRQWGSSDDGDEIDHEREMDRQQGWLDPLQPAARSGGWNSDRQYDSFEDDDLPRREPAPWTSQEVTKSPTASASSCPQRRPEASLGERLHLPEALWSRTDVVRALCFKKPRQFLFSIEAELTRLLQAPEGAVLRLPALAPHYQRLLQAMCRRFGTKEDIDGSEIVISTTQASFAPLLPLASLVPRSWADQDPSTWEDRRRDPWSMRPKSLTPCPGLKVPPTFDFSDFGPGAAGDDLGNLAGFGGSRRNFNQHELQQIQEEQAWLQLLPKQWRFMEPPHGNEDDGVVVTFSLDVSSMGDGVGVVLCDQSSAAQEPLQRLLSSLHGEQIQRPSRHGSFHVLLVQPSPQGPTESGMPRWSLKLGFGEHSVEGQWIDSRTVVCQDQQESGSWAPQSSTFWMATYAAQPSWMGGDDGGMLVEAGLGRFPWGRVFRTRVQRRGQPPLRTVAVGALGRDQITNLSAITLESSVCPDLASRDHLVRLVSSARRGTAAERSPWWLQQGKQGLVAMLDGVAVCESPDAAMTLQKRATETGAWAAHTLACESIDEAWSNTGDRQRHRAKAVRALGKQIAMELALDDWSIVEADMPGSSTNPTKTSKKPPLPAPPTSAPPPPPTEQQQQHRQASVPLPPRPPPPSSSLPPQPPQPQWGQSQWSGQSAAQWPGSERRSPQQRQQEPQWEQPQVPMEQQQQQQPHQQDWDPSLQQYQSPHEERLTHSFADGSYSGTTRETSQMSASAPSFSPQTEVAGLGNLLVETSSPGINLWSESNRMYSPSYQNQARMTQQMQPDSSFSALSAAAPAFKPGGNAGQDFSGASADMSYQQQASDAAPASAEMWTEEYEGWAYSDETGWYQQYDSSTYEGGNQEGYQTTQRKQSDGTGLSSNALPFIPGEGAAAAASMMSASAQEFSPSGTTNPSAQAAGGMVSWDQDGQDQAWDAAQEAWGAAEGDQGQDTWTNGFEEQPGMQNNEWLAKNGGAKSNGKSWRSDARGWDGGGQAPGKGWENAGKGWEGKGGESTVLDKLFDPTPKGKGWELLSTKGKSWEGKEGNSKGGWSGTPKGKPWDSMPKGKGWEAPGKGVSWEGGKDGKDGKGWDASYAGKGWESAGKGGWPGKGWDAKGKDPSMGQNSKGWDSKGWHGEKGKETGDWNMRGGKSWSGDPGMQGKGWEMGPGFEGKDHRGQRGKGRTDYGRHDAGPDSYEDGKWGEGWHEEDKWDDKWDDKWQGGWKDEWWSEWRGPEDGNNGENGGKGGKWKQHDDWRQERRQEKKSPAKDKRERKANRSEKLDSDGAALGRRPPLRRRAGSSGSEGGDSSAPSSAGSNQQHGNRKGRGKSKGHAQEGSPAQSGVTLSEDDGDEDFRSRRRDARGDGKARGRGKGRSAGDEAAPRSKLRQMWQQQREDERRKNQPAGHQSEDDDDQGGAKAAVDKTALKRHLGI